jgi:hypothetical protein
MSTLVASARHSISAHWLVSAVAAVIIVAALAVSLVTVMAGSSSSSGGSGTSLFDNSDCRSYQQGPC